MISRAFLLFAALSLAPFASAQSFNLELQPAPESIYAPPAPSSDNSGVNEGGVHLDVAVRYLTDYVYRGVDRGELIGTNQILPSDSVSVTPLARTGNEDSPNLQLNEKISFDLGKLPHPYVALFVNVFDS